MQNVLQMPFTVYVKKNVQIEKVDTTRKSYLEGQGVILLDKIPHHEDQFREDKGICES